MRTRIAAGLLGLAVVVAAAPPVSAAPAPGGGSLTWSVAPAGPDGPDGRPGLTYNLDPGAAVTDHVAVTNHSEQPLTLRLYASDAFTTAGGGFDLLAGAAQPRDTGAWIKPARTTLDLPATSRVVVPFTMRIPENATPGDHAAGLVASLAAAGTDADGNRVTVDHRVGTRVYLRVSGPLQPALSITGVRLRSTASWNPFRLPSIHATYAIGNTGNVRLSAQPSARAHGPFSLGTAMGSGTALPEILPGGSVETTVRLDSVAPLFRSWVTLSALPAPADGRPIDPAPVRVSATHAVWLVPWAQLGLLLVVGLLIAGGVLTRRRRKRRLAAAVAAAVVAAEERGRASASTPAPAPASASGAASGTAPASGAPGEGS